MRIDKQLQTGFATTANNSKKTVKQGERSSGGVSTNFETFPHPPEVVLELSPNPSGSSAPDRSAGLNQASALILSRSIKNHILADPGVAVSAQVNIHPQQALELLDEATP
jgi:hypothetical protein